MYRPSDLRQFLDGLGVSARKQLSQNFLIDKNILDKIIKAAGVVKGDRVLEIGGGPGALTEALLQREAKVTVVEKDRLFAKALHRFQVEEVFEGDIRDFPFEKLEALTKVVANIPYQLTSVILGLLLPKTALFSQVTLMVQEEVARRLVAKPRSPDYSALTLFAQFYAEVRYEFFVSRHCFYPAPKVDSAVVTFCLKKTPEIDAKYFLKFMHQAFSSRRKMLRGTLKGYFAREKLEELLAARRLSLEARAEELSLDDFLFLFSNLTV